MDRSDAVGDGGPRMHPEPVNGAACERASRQTLLRPQRLLEWVEISTPNRGTTGLGLGITLVLDDLGLALLAAFRASGAQVGQRRAQNAVFPDLKRGRARLGGHGTTGNKRPHLPD